MFNGSRRIILISMEDITRIVPKNDFYCTYCGKEFGDEVINLALHIAKKHDQHNSRHKPIFNTHT